MDKSQENPTQTRPLTRRQLVGAGVAGGLVSALRPVLADRLPAGDRPFDFTEATIADLQEGMRSGRLNARSVAEKYLERIEALDRNGPALRSVIDPEVGINGVDLGLVYRIDIEGDRVRVTLGLTSPACPLGPHLSGAADTAIRIRVPEARSVRVDLTLDPPWKPEMMSEEARRLLGWNG